LVSTKDPDTTYVGYTSNVRKRLNKHNSYNGGSYGTNIDHSNLAPFGLLAMVVGFEDRVHARSFEQTWKHQIDLRRRNTKGKILSMTLNVQKQDRTLNLIECGYVKEIPETII
jgi:predicted GIY-YIG superfamily endonuclease